MAEMSREEMEQEMVRVFQPMDAAADEYRRGPLDGFGQGYSMQADAYAAAPEWLQAWDDKHRWLICFTQGWEGLVRLAKAFGWSKEKLLDDLIYYKSKHGN